MSETRNYPGLYFPQKTLNVAAMKGKLDSVLRILDSGANPEERDGHFGNTGLHWAIKSDNINILKLYQERGFDFSVTNYKGWSLAHLAADGSYCKTLKWLLNNGADIEREDEWKQTPLHVAVYKRHLDAVKMLLLYGASPNRRDGKANTPVMIAAINGDVDMAKLLFEHGADLRSTDRWDRTLLHLARSLPLLEWLVEHNLDINRRDDWSRTPLHDAAQASYQENASFLLEKGADVEAQDKEGCTPLYHAAQKGKIEIVRLLLENGANPESVAKDGTTPVEVTSNAEIKNLLLQKKSYVRSDGQSVS